MQFHVVHLAGDLLLTCHSCQIEQPRFARPDFAVKPLLLEELPSHDVKLLNLLSLLCVEPALCHCCVEYLILILASAWTLEAVTLEQVLMLQHLQGHSLLAMYVSLETVHEQCAPMRPAQCA